MHQQTPILVVGTDNGLWAMSVPELKVLGVIKADDDSVRGALASADVDGDGSPEIAMVTKRGRVALINTTDGKTVVGRVVNQSGDNMMVMTNMLDPNGLVTVNTRKIESVEKSKVSMMPKNLLDTFKEDEILDLVAYLMSRGDRNHKMFK